ncbi:hypothetical protein [Bartonella sp. CB74]|uniref:hypothetical protein n=1 Tax=Bartonella sp. CB74 TaxID=3113620 RepID=UPI002F966D19
MLKMFKKNVSLGASAAIVSFLLQVADVNANVERGQFQQNTSVSMAVQEDIKAMNMAVSSALSENVEKTEGFEKVSVSAVSYNIFSGFWSGLWRTVASYFSGITGVIIKL